MYSVTQAPTYFTPREARAEYARLRAVAEKRIQRLQGAGYKIQGPTSFKPLSRSASQAEIYKSLADVAKFISMKSSTVTGRRQQVKKFVEKMHELGYDFINENNVDEFGEFMKEAKLHDEYRGYDSEEVVELFHLAKEKHVKPQDLAKDLDTWIGNEKLINMKRSRSTIGSEELRERLNMGPAEEKDYSLRSPKSRTKSRISHQMPRQPRSGLRGPRR